MNRWQDAHGPTWNGLDTELSPGQSWAIPAGPQWQARLDRAGRAHVIGRALAEHPEHGVRYADKCLSSRYRRGWVPERWPNSDPGWKNGHPFWSRIRPWHTFERACRAASYHERMVIAAKRQAAQAGQGGE